MDDVDALIEKCCAVPADRDRRLVLADKLAELSENECEDALRSEDGEQVVREVYRIADKLKRSPCLRLLWSVAVVMRKMTPPVIQYPGRKYREMSAAEFQRLIESQPAESLQFYPSKGTKDEK